MASRFWAGVSRYRSLGDGVTMLKPEFFLWSRTMCKSLENTGFSEFNIVFHGFWGCLVNMNGERNSGGLVMI